jgi:ribose 5-phosphate isomerase A
MALSTIQSQLKHTFPSASITLRMATPTDKAGPVVTDNGNLILDCDFGPIQEEPGLLYQKIKCLSGVLDVGLFCKMAEVAYLGNLEKDGGEILRVN